MKKLRIEGVETVILDVPLVRPHRFTRSSTDAHPTLLVTVITRASAVESARASCRPARMELFTGDIVRTEGRDQHRLASEGVATPPSTRGRVA